MTDLNTIVLASQSPRRRRMFEDLGISFEVIPADIDESMLAGETPTEFAVRAAGEKGLAVASRLQQSENRRPWIVSADTIVVLGDDVLVKPVNRDNAIDMLSRLSGKTHRVITGWAVGKLAQNWIVESDETQVTFHHLTKEQIEKYVDTGEGMDKAGSYAIQGIGSFLVAGISGNYFNVVGLPISRVTRALMELGVMPEFLK